MKTKNTIAGYLCRKEKNLLSLASDHASFLRGYGEKKRDHARVLPSYHAMVLADDISHHNECQKFDDLIDNFVYEFLIIIESFLSL